MKLRLNLCLSLLLLWLTAGAQEFIDIDFRPMRQDTLLPVWGHSFLLEDGFRDFDWSAAIEFPEFEELDEADAQRWHLDRYDLPSWPEITANVGVSAGQGMLDVSFVPVVQRGGRYYAITSFKPVIRKAATKRQYFRKASASGRYAEHSVLAEGDWVKLRIPSTGVYRVSAKTLKSLGFKDISKVRLYGYGGGLLPESGLGGLADDLKEIPAWHDADGILFYGNGPDGWKMDTKGRMQQVTNTYSTYGSYFLTAQDSVMPLAFDSVPATATDNVFDTYPDRALYENDAFSWMPSGRQFYDSYDFQNGPTQKYKFDLDGLVTEDSVLLTVAFAAKSQSPTTLAVSVNDKSVDVITVPGVSGTDAAVAMTKTFSCNGLFSYDSNVSLTHNRTAGISGRLDYIRLQFTRRLALRGSYTAFRTGVYRGNASFRIAAQGQDVQVWQIDTDGTVRTVESSTADGICTTSGIRCGSKYEYVVLDTRAQFPEAKVEGRIDNQDLHALEIPDLVIIVPSSGKLTRQAERLAEAHRKTDGIKVHVVTAAQVYNEFSSGTPDATAYRRFMKMFYDRAGQKQGPRWLLLFGDGAWDNRMLTPDWNSQNPDDYLLCYESENSFSETRSYVMEDYFGLLDDDEGSRLMYEKPDIGVGRFPVSTVREASVLTDKTIAYIGSRDAGPWMNKVLILGDDGDDNIHMEGADAVAEMLREKHPSLYVKKIYWDSFKMEVSASGNSYPAVRQEIMKQLEEGAVFVDYVGHGSPDVLSHELVMDKADMKSLKSTRLPLWFTASCDISPFDGTQENLGEDALMNPTGGALAMLSTTRTVYSSLNDKINMQFSANLFETDSLGRRATMGDALRLAKSALATSGSKYQDYSENKIHYVLLGDPALALAIPQLKAVVDSMSHRTPTRQTVAGAGDVITVTGHIENAGVTDRLFNGTVSPMVFDSERHIVCLNNADDADKPFEYDDRDRVLYAGNDSVRAGQFSFTFPVPLDINYSDESGRIGLFAADPERRLTASGFHEDFIIGGTSETLSSDSTGPEISMWLNNPEFIYGGKVNSTPCLVAELHDEDGINTSGNGVGHDILLVVDNDPHYTYVLNSSYTAVAGDFTRGRVTFVIPELPEGKHRLMLRAWDVLNNSSVSELAFEVVPGLKPKMAELYATENPAREKTTFAVVHDRPGMNVECTVEVSDPAGRIVWTGKVTDSSASGTSLIDWNLCTSAGQRVRGGIYFCRVTVSGPDGGTVSGSTKLIVL